MLSVALFLVLLNVISLSVIMFNVKMLNIINMLNVKMLNVIMLNVVKLNVVAQDKKKRHLHWQNVVTNKPGTAAVVLLALAPWADGQTREY
jgi:hypothetical protein